MNDARAGIPYCGAAPAPADLWSSWNLDPVLLLALLLAAAGYARLAGAGGAGADRGGEGRRVAFMAAWVGLLLLYVSPFCALGSALFAARAAHHIVLAAVIAPLLAWALAGVRARIPGGVMLWTAAQSATLWLWNAPQAYAWALSSDAGFWLMQASLLFTAIGFWAALLRASAPAALAGLLATMVQMGLLGALLLSHADALYAPHLFATWPWGLSPLEDQQLAGLLIWAPGAAFYLAAALGLLGRWLRDPQPA